MLFSIQGKYVRLYPCILIFFLLLSYSTIKDRCMIQFSVDHFIELFFSFLYFFFESPLSPTPSLFSCLTLFLILYFPFSSLTCTIPHLWSRILTSFQPPTILESPCPCSSKQDSVTTTAVLDYVTAYIACLSSDRLDGLYTTVGKWMSEWVRGWE